MVLLNKHFWKIWVRGRGAHGQAQRERDDRPVGAQHGGGLQRAQPGRRGRGLLSGLHEGGMVWDFVYARRDCLLTQRP